MRKQLSTQNPELPFNQSGLKKKIDSWRGEHRVDPRRIVVGELWESGKGSASYRDEVRVRGKRRGVLVWGAAAVYAEGGGSG